jgi:cob(I)alamin adenosyltransferase
MKHRFHIYTGKGKGKTTAAIGLAVRALGAGLKVAFVQFDKGHDGPGDYYFERRILRQLANLDLFPFGKERVLGPKTFRFKNVEADFEEARKALSKAEDLIMDGGHDLVILDEIITCVMTKLVQPVEVIHLIDQYNQERKCELVMTGHEAWPELMTRADLVTDMRKVKHYFDEKSPPKEGIEY